MSETTPEVPEVEPDEPTPTVERPEPTIWLSTWESNAADPSQTFIPESP